MTCHTSLDPGPQELPGQRAQKDSQSKGLGAPAGAYSWARWEQVPEPGMGQSRLVSGTFWEGSMCVKSGEEQQLPDKINPLSGWAVRDDNLLATLGQSQPWCGRGRREGQSGVGWGPAIGERAPTQQLPSVPCLLNRQPRSWARKGHGQGSGFHCSPGNHPMGPWSSHLCNEIGRPGDY